MFLDVTTGYVLGTGRFPASGAISLGGARLGPHIPAFLATAAILNGDNGSCSPGPLEGSGVGRRAKSTPLTQRMG